MDRRYTLRLFGTPALVDASGTPIPFRTRKQLAVLVVLHLDGQEQPVPRDRLTDYLWPGVTPERGSHSLSQALSTIRAVLGNDAVSRGGGGIRMLRPVVTDLELLALEPSAVADLSLPLADFDSVAGAEFAHWVDSVRVRLTRLAAQVLRDQLSTARASGSVNAVHERAAQLYQVDPLSEAAVHALAERHLLEDDTIGAIRLVREHADRIRRELNCDPHPELRRLAERLESGVRLRGAAPPTGVLPLVPRRPPVFLGRERELARLESLWAQARGGRLVTCLMTGSPGLGKSSLIERFAASVTARTWPALTVSCQEIGRDVPFATVADLLYLVGRDPQAGGADPEWLGEASRLAPGLRARFPGIPQPPSVAPEAVKLRAAEAIAHVLGVVSDGGPLLIALDNVHHIDPVSAEILHLVMRRFEHSAVLLLGAARDRGELAGGLDTAMGALAWRVQEPLAPLDPGTARALVKELVRGETPVMPPDVQVKIAELAQGIPYLIEMLVGDWLESPDGSLVAAELGGRSGLEVWQPPEMMRRAFERQFAGLDDGAQMILSLLAVADRPLAPEEVASLLQLSQSDTHRGNLVLLRRGILRFADDGLMFKNELHRAFVYRATDPETRRYLHRLVAGHIHAPAKDKSGAGTAELERSHHLARSGDMEAAIRSAIRGARAALERGAYEEVENVLGPLTETVPPAERPSVLLLLAQARCAQGRYQAALDTVRGLELAALSTSDQVAIRRVRAEAVHRARLGPDSKIRELAEAYCVAAQTLQDPEELLHAIQLKLEVATDEGALETIAELRQTAREVAGDAKQLSVRARALMTDAYCRLLLNQHVEAGSAFLEAASLVRATKGTGDLVQCLKGTGIAYSQQGNQDAAIVFYRLAISVAEEAGDFDSTAIMWSNLSVAHQITGDFAAAAQSLVKAAQVLKKYPNARRGAEISINSVGLLVGLQVPERGRQLLSQAIRFADAADSWRLAVNAKLAKADLLLVEGNVEGALAAFHEAESLRAGRALFWVNRAAYERLKHYALWRSGGCSLVRQYAETTKKENPLMSLAEVFEVSLFDEWLEYHETGEWQDRALMVLKQATSHGFFGVLVYLLAIRAGVPGMEATDAPAAEAVQALFPGRITTIPAQSLDEISLDVSPT